MTTLIIVKNRETRTVKPRVGDYTIPVMGAVPVVQADAVLVDNWYPATDEEREWYEHALTRLRWGGHLWIVEGTNYREWIRTPAIGDDEGEAFAWRDVPTVDAPPSPTSRPTSRSRKPAPPTNSDESSSPETTTKKTEEPA